MKRMRKPSNFALTILLGLIPQVRADKLVLVAGGGTGGDGSPAAKARLLTPFGVDFDKAGNLYFVEYTGQRVGKVDPRGLVTTFAGTGI